MSHGLSESLLSGASEGLELPQMGRSKDDQQVKFEVAKVSIRFGEENKKRIISGDLKRIEHEGVVYVRVAINTLSEKLQALVRPTVKPEEQYIYIKAPAKEQSCAVAVRMPEEYLVWLARVGLATGGIMAYVACGVPGVAAKVAAGILSGAGCLSAFYLRDPIEAAMANSEVHYRKPVAPFLETAPRQKEMPSSLELK